MLAFRVGYPFFTDNGQTNASGDAVIWMFDGGKITATPPSGSNFKPASVTPSIPSDTSVTVTLQQPVTLTGYIYDEYGNPLPNQTVRTARDGVGYTAITNSSGSYSFSELPIGNYNFVEVERNDPFNPPANNDGTLNEPKAYLVRFGGFSLTENTTKDFAILGRKVTVHVQDTAGNSISGAGVTASKFNGYPFFVDNGQSDNTGDVILWMFDGGKITVSPPAGSSFKPTSVTPSIASATTVTITLEQPVSLNGHIYDEYGSPLPNQTVHLAKDGVGYTTTTNTTGSYSFSELPTGQYSYIEISGGNEGETLNLPHDYELRDNLSLSQNTIKDFTIPARKVTIHVQDSLNNPIANVPVSGTNQQSYPLFNQGGQTDAAGNVILWLFNNASISANPPSGSIYSGFTLNNVAIPADLTQIISLQFSHETPVTIANLATQNTDGKYTDPTTVTLTANAAAGYTIANTYYTIDGGDQQTYTAPVDVSGSGEHTITYWSKDDSGVQEAPKTKTFTIQANNPPVLESIGNKTVNEGALLQFTISATDPDGNALTYSASNLPQGSTFNSQTHTFSWTPGFDQEGNYANIEFTVTDNGSPIELDTELITITVGNINRAPLFDPIGSQEVLEDTQLTFTVHTTDPDGNTVTLSAENLPQGATFDSQIGAFSWKPTLSQEGNYIVTFKATDNGTPSETGTVDVAITVGDNPTPTEQAETIITTVIEANLPTNTENSYLANLKKIPPFIEQGKIQPAINQLNAFITKVEEDYTNGEISQEVYDTLINLANNLLADLQ